MDLEQIVPAIALVAVLIFIFPTFIRNNNQNLINKLDTLNDNIYFLKI